MSERAMVRDNPPVDGKSDMASEPLFGIWRNDLSFYLTDLRHPVMRQEWVQWQLSRGRRYDSPMPPRERRQFDREMIAKYSEICPPPSGVQFHLVVYDIFDRQEDYAEEQKRLAAMPPMVETERMVYVDEDL